MMIRRDWLLQQLGITQWRLRRPAVLQGEVAIKLPDHTRLLLVTDSLPPEAHHLVTDVVRSLMLTPAQITRLTPDQVMMLPNDVHCHCWWLGLEAIRDFGGISLYTPSLTVLQEDSGSKRELWQQINDNEHPFTTITG
ncbi:MAG: DNA polymerase III subunit psi [Sodalis sp. Psp]|nr:DNA polymerase III subunit psi [Sodalis sp. Psp]MCR3756523.1 DNA polymerase III subunit psi [Sodalis sp. Ppy]